MSENKLVPKLRFPEFTNLLEYKKLEDIIQFSKQKYNPLNNEKNYKCIELEHISQNDGRLLGYTNSKEQKSIKQIFDENYILFGKLRPYLKKYWLSTFKGVCSTEIWVFNSLNDFVPYIYFLIQTSKFNYIANVSSGSKMPRSDWNFMKNCKFYLPSLKEQEKIASFLSKIDEKIDLLNQKLDQMKQFKKGLMQQIFAQKLRFDGFTDEWKKFSIKDCIIESKLKNQKEEDLPVISSTLSGIYFQSEYFDNEVASDSTKDYKIIKKGLFTYRSMSDTGKFRFNIQNIVPQALVSPAYPVFDVNSFIKSLFFEYYLNYNQDIKRQLLIFKEGGTRYALSISKFKKIDVYLPSIEEQEKIANFLSNIDNKINLIQLQLNQTEEFKRGLLQSLFV